MEELDLEIIDLEWERDHYAEEFSRLTKEDAELQIERLTAEIETIETQLS
jgi:hypothetical protein